MLPFRLGSVLLSLLCFSAPAGASALDRYLVARWTFNDGSLKADTGGTSFRKQEIGRDATLSLAGGTAQLGAGTLLVCDSLNAREQPALAKSVTLWARLKLDAPAPETAFLFGFLNQGTAGDWGNMVLTVRARNEPANATNAFVRFAPGTHMNSPSRSVTVEPGNFVSVALVFDGATKTVTYIVDGRALPMTHKDATALPDFTHFAVGRLQRAAPLPVTVDEVRVYSVALSPEWVADIAPVK